MVESVKCIFCERVRAGDLIVAAELAVAFADAHPVNPGHTLIVPRRHEADYFALTDAEQTSMWRLVADVREHLKHTRIPDGYNLGVNAGKAAGQTVAHTHLHVIPRYAGDVEDPRGGVRWIFPARAKYWTE